MTFVSKLPPLLTIGFYGEHNARPIPLDITDELTMWPDASIALYYVRPGEDTAYRAEDSDASLTGNILTWTPSLHATAIAGEGGLAQIVFTKTLSGEDTLVGLSQRMLLTVMPSVLATQSSVAPATLENLVSRIEVAAGAVDAALANSVRSDTAQTFTPTKKAQARENIGAGTASITVSGTGLIITTS